ncbi:MAG: hypothetical protein A2041_13465 [Bacteroidetes bacterium GWA2_31_9b]|nr:MAG: hypothetical protein A2041_13465 [Bacteroidetes bacterium GWA2_31_9b]
MFSELEKYKNKGHFFFEKGDNLKEASKNVPNLPGVYYILKLAQGKVEIVYIGKSGTILQNGSFKEQGLQSRLNNKQDGMKRQLFFEGKFNEEKIDALDLYWFVTFDKSERDLPSYVESIIMQRYFEVHGRLPEWNKEF